MTALTALRKGGFGSAPHLVLYVFSSLSEFEGAEGLAVAAGGGGELKAVEDDTPPKGRR
jgi:hypothetical protein